MAIDLSALEPVHRWQLEAPLAPIQGHRFQPTGFPDIGSSLYPDPTGRGDRLVVESPQSVANHLEATVWDDRTDLLIPAAQGLSYVRILDEAGGFFGSSVTEPHRLASPHVLADGQVRAELDRRLGPRLDRRRLPEALLDLDVGSLLHGVFLAPVAGHLRVARCLGGFIEALDARPVLGGGVKRDLHDRTGPAKNGRGGVVFVREEFVASEIRAYFSLDLGQLRGFGLSPRATELLVLLALYKVRAWLDGPLRLRSRCTLAVAGPLEASPIPLPPLAALELALCDAISSAGPWPPLEVRAGRKTS